MDHQPNFVAEIERLMLGVRGVDRTGFTMREACAALRDTPRYRVQRQIDEAIDRGEITLGKEPVKNRWGEFKMSHVYIPQTRPA